MSTGILYTVCKLITPLHYNNLLCNAYTCSEIYVLISLWKKDPAFIAGHSFGGKVLLEYLRKKKEK